MISQGWKLLLLTIFSLLLVTAPLVQAQTETQAVQPIAPNTPAVVTGTAQQTDSNNPPQAQSAPTMPEEMQIGPGDLLEIRVFGVQDLTQETRVSASGDINVALIGPVHVGGLTQSEAESAIADKFRLGDFLKDPHVSVFTKEYATQGVSVMGEVAKPGVYPLLGPRRLFDVISLAGGLTNRAGKVIAIVHRDDPDKVVKLEMSSDVEKAADINVAIQPGDTISVARAGVVYVVGDVARPAGFMMENNERLTVLQAVALAGGTNGSAKLNNAKIIRRTPNGIQEIPMPLKDILSAKAEDVPLLAEDVLFVPRSIARSSARRSAEAVLQVATGLAIYRR